jgi:L-alanine-DL-glutamate epimerase-like enolase superfamily enzyme
MVEVEHITVTPVRVPLAQTVYASGKAFSHRDYLLVDVRCTDGSWGIGFSYVGTGGGRAAASATQELLVPEVLGQDPHATEYLWQRMYRATLIQGRAGLVMNGLSAIDIALWDHNARAAGLPLYRYLGGRQDKPRLRAYASGGYHAGSRDVEALRDELSSYIDMGFSAVKIKAGHLGVKEEERRLQVARDVLGEDRLLMLDLYNAFDDYASALPFVHMCRHYKPYWIEDPFSPDDLDNYARLASQIPEPIATGEFHYSRFTFKHIITSGAATILQAEAPRCGGITEWRKIAALAAGYGVTMSPCWFHQVHVQLLPTISNPLFLEYFVGDAIFNFDQLIDAPLSVTEGYATPPTTPGLGFSFDPHAVKAFALT